jgi:hypothetical protein
MHGHAVQIQIGRLMSSDERSQGLATEQPLPDHERIDHERQESMRQLAYVLIDIFIAQSKTLSLAGAA